MTVLRTLQKSSQHPASEDIKTVLEVAKAQVEQEFEITERLDSKARGQVALAGSWFLGAQAIVTLAFRLGPPSGATLVAVAIGATVGALSLFLTTAISYGVWKPRRESDISPAALEAVLREAESDYAVIEPIAQTYIDTLRERREGNGERLRALRTASVFWFATYAAALFEVLIALGSAAS